MTIRIQEHNAGRVPGPGFYRMPAALYHADPAPEPSLSASIANMLVDETALHAWHSHPRLNPRHQGRDANAAMDKGSVAHEVVLRKGGGIAVLDFKDWRTNAARAARDAARAKGLTPVLAKTAEEVRDIASSVLTAIQQTEVGSDGFHEAAQS